MGCVIHKDAPLEWRAPGKDKMPRSVTASSP
jgi:hypothetical protein